MGQEASTLSSFEGLQISRVQHASPSFEAGLIPYFDFIIGVDTVALDPDNYTFFYEYVKKNENKPLKLRVFNIRIRVEREVTVTPRDWSGDRKNGLMGFNVSWESAEKAVESTWHITNVVEGSAASKADLMATRDYLLGMQLPADFATMTVFKDSSEFHTRLEEWRMVQEAIAIQKPGSKCSLLMLVFDSIANEVKEIIVEMASPEQSLGVEVANGYLHVVPPTPGSTNLPRLTRCVVTKPAIPANNNNNVTKNALPPSQPDFDQDQIQSAQPGANTNSNNNHHHHHATNTAEETNNSQQQQKTSSSTTPSIPALPTFQQQQHPNAAAAASNGSISSASASSSSFPHPPPPTPNNSTNTFSQQQQQPQQNYNSSSSNGSAPPMRQHHQQQNYQPQPPTMMTLPKFPGPALSSGFPNTPGFLNNNQQQHQKLPPPPRF